jgi:pimeloyl-ACP methyl ester carboxylesterase
VVDLAFTRLTDGDGSERLLVVGASLGTSVETLWGATARQLPSTWEVIGWDPPGHGRSPAASGPFSIADLADEVRLFVKGAANGRRTAYAGVSLGGAVGFELALDPGPLSAVVAIASARKIGESAGWHARADLVRRDGTPVLVAGAEERWFARGFAERDPQTVGALLTALADTDQESYALACEALAEFDLRGQATDVVVVAGEHDVVVPPTGAERVLTGCGHLPPAEDPAATAALLQELLTTEAVP